ncbi:actin-like ATPase involved in cell morphogenesis [Acidovorax sp. CF316]|uniref:rod shape-determining protein n=1 Tax=Acidovorax sp. CF316 TaxID=1144317 RepID=UPI00026BD81B|nr:rod shape-determining protein [Acidovorax sp. CF316]EJE50605.1 actin-like ATPase involved in cell morphogenesis [Acidovorax sp. CF316]
MLESITPLLYIQLSPQRVSVRNARTGTTWDEVPEIALQDRPKPRVEAVGSKAREAAARTGARIANPLAHPRSLVSDFVLAQQLLQYGVRHVLGKGSFWQFTPSPRIVLHLPANPEGGYTQTELRALRELALGCGASRATLWQGPALTDGELLSGQYPATGQTLE